MYKRKVVAIVSKHHETECGVIEQETAPTITATVNYERGYFEMLCTRCLAAQRSKARIKKVSRAAQEFGIASNKTSL